jgi:acylphosphatase
MPVAKRCWVAGRVQGVFYRKSTQQQARKLGLRGYAKNLSDGRVEVLAIGEQHAVEQLIAWLWQGPPAANVSSVETADVNIDELGRVAAEFATA